jgi:predicted DNA-binding protein
LEKSVAEMEDFEDIDTELERFKNGDYSSTGAKYFENKYYEELQIIS